MILLNVYKVTKAFEENHCEVSVELSIILDVKKTEGHYLKLKNSTRTSKCQVFSSTVRVKPQKWTKLARQGPFGILNIHFIAKYQRN